ncbi:MAG: thioredoxin family protein [Pseudomonadota bacterium]
MLRLVLVGSMALGLLFHAAAGAVEEREPERHFFNETWNEFDQELEKARAEGKNGVFMFFEMDACPFCDWMKEEVLSRSDVQEYYRENFLNFTVDIEGSIDITTFDGEMMSQREFATDVHRVRATPVMIYFDLEGDAVHRYTGRTSGAEEFIRMGEFIASGAHEEMDFENYQRQKNDADNGSSGADYF